MLELNTTNQGKEMIPQPSYNVPEIRQKNDFTRAVAGSKFPDVCIVQKSDKFLVYTSDRYSPIPSLSLGCAIQDATRLSNNFRLILLNGSTLESPKIIREEREVVVIKSGGFEREVTKSR